MNHLRKIIQESIKIAENTQLADKIYFTTGRLSPKVREVILHITQGDAWTKLLSDIYYAEITEHKKQGSWAVNAIGGDDDEEDVPSPDGTNDVMRVEDWKKIRAIHNQLKAYNKNVFPIKGLNINGVKDIWELIRALKERGVILENIKKLPSIAIRNMKNEIRQERDATQMQDYRDRLQHVLAYYGALLNRDPRLRKNIEAKMFKANVTIDELIDFGEDKENLIGGKNFTRNMLKRVVADDDDMEIVYEHGNVMVIDVMSPDAIKKVGCNSLWCFTYGKEFERAWSQWNNYSTNDHVYVIVDFSVPSDSADFMHVLIKPLDYNAQPVDDNEAEVNDSKLFNMANEESYSAVRIVNQLIGDEAPFILNFGEPVKANRPTSKWPHENPNQTKLDLKEVQNMIRAILEKKELYIINYTYGRL